jgi:2-hydroxy-4-carboxymuconate semialdehyde hemiacetal dehydrogenase
MAGHGAFGTKHLEAIANIPGIEVATLAGGSADNTKDVAAKFGIPHWSTDLGECLSQPGVGAAILTTPTPMHAVQAIECMRAGKHVMIEIPMADNLRDSEEIVKVQRETGVIAMAGHTRRFNPSHK